MCNKELKGEQAKIFNMEMEKKYFMYTFFEEQIKDTKSEFMPYCGGLVKA